MARSVISKLGTITLTTTNQTTDSTFHAVQRTHDRRGHIQIVLTTPSILTGTFTIRGKVDQNADDDGAVIQTLNMSTNTKESIIVLNEYLMPEVFFRVKNAKTTTGTDTVTVYLME